MHDWRLSAAADCCGHHREDVTMLNKDKIWRYTPKISVVVALLLGVFLT